MKFLAIEHEMKEINPDLHQSILEMEARHVYTLQMSGHLREIYFDQQRNAVLILECENKAEVRDILDNLPLVQNGFIGFDLRTLSPYDGFSRIMDAS